MRKCKPKKEMFSKVSFLVFYYRVISTQQKKLSVKELSSSEVSEIAEKAFKQLFNDRKMPEVLNKLI